jgi:hypothetical protein
MTPEERVKRLKDFDRWTVNSVAPRGVVAKRRPQWIVPVIAGVVTSVLTIAIVLGVVNLRDYRAQQPANSPTPTATAEPLGLRPATAFAFTCADLLTDATVSAFLGVPVEAHDMVATNLATQWQEMLGTYVVEAGGLACEWSNGEAMGAEDYAGFQVQLLPNGSDALKAFGREDYVSCSGWICNSEYATGTTWVESTIDGFARKGEITKAEQKVEFKQLHADIDAVIAAAPPAAEVPLGEGAGTYTQCSAVLDDATISSVVGENLTGGGGPGGGEGIPFLHGEAHARIGAYTFCVYNADDGRYGPFISEMPGGAWIPNTYATTIDSADVGFGKPVQLDGLEDGESAFLHCRNETTTCVLDLAVGGDWVRIALPRSGSPEQGGGLSYDRPKAEVLADIAAAVIANRG